MRATATCITAASPTTSAAMCPPGARCWTMAAAKPLHADRVAAKAGRLMLCEAAPNVREHLAARFASVGNIEVTVAGRRRGAAGGLARSHRHAFGRAISQPGGDRRAVRAVQATAEAGRAVRAGRRDPAAGLADRRCRGAAALRGGERIPHRRACRASCARPFRIIRSCAPSSGSRSTKRARCGRSSRPRDLSSSARRRISAIAARA